ncbi:hypothetical protein FRC91_07535 [Bradymonadales bacterium TMQ1]|uniref:Gluconate 2-dehydrogenase subunit 3 family protein n=1 Tax=Lujinxingia sediminis TaxID=2480984 RepID=A0ABY0CT65_9DELT|nr:hypothetical protein [Lujinxingia sediminis]RVU44795.1 hypothetical protein EA187_09655 [Lujinxingia sediminis]TXC76574.1 hypothetical protein FRC91_07535 [Bradymonadales bacterium TMQ1]
MARMQTMGLVRTGRLLARLSNNSPPMPGAIPPWLSETLERAMARVCAADDADFPDVRACGALDAALLFIGGMPATTQEELQSMIAILEYAPYAFGPRRRRLTHLSDDEIDRFLLSLEASPLMPARAMFKALKSVCMMGYYTRPQLWPAIGYSLSGNPGVPAERR